MSKKILGMGNAVLDILTKVEDNFIISNNLYIVESISTFFLCHF